MTPRYHSTAPPPVATLAATGLLLAAAGAVLAGFWAFSYDDAFITFRYARTLLEEGRLAFGAQPVTYGTTAPGYAVLLAALGASGLAIPAWGSVLGVAGLLAVPLVLLHWRREPGERAALLPWLLPAGLLALGLRWNVEMLGGETLPAMGLVAIGAFLLFARETNGGREVAAGLVLAAAAVLRLDAGLACLVFGLVHWHRQCRSRRRFPWPLALAGAVPLALYGVGLWAYFGQVLPHTLDAKQAETIFTSASLSSAQWAWLVRTAGTAGTVSLLALAALGAMALLAARAWRRPGLAATGLWLAGHEIAYRLLGVPFAPWYHVATVTALVLLAGYGAAALARWCLGMLRSAEPSTLAVSAVTAALLMPVILPTLTWLTESWGTPPDPRWGVYHAAGEHIRAHSRPGDEVAAVEIGFLGYSSRRPVLDLMGLVSPQVVPAREAGELAALVAERRPRFILDVPLFRRHVLAGVLDHGWTERCYAPAATFPAPDAMGGEAILLERLPEAGCS